MSLDRLQEQARLLYYYFCEYLGLARLDLRRSLGSGLRSGGLSTGSIPRIAAKKWGQELAERVPTN